ncbi:hypothetical protein C6P46_005921 [Rhodotorula mucilaginosa]|uniref:Protein N-terminal glutamine amidohydrolase n=1 Tax=Rhodotorula mucilaginosa TaxID=5537 RepID=A0A9P6W784_RHOMI|nr:hypothetical protein C6P46_005921 [Rhodotorula mucilaginosa]
MDPSTLKTEDAPYTRYYCEENVYKLLEAALAQIRAAPATPAPRQLFALFVSNPERRVLLFHQAASRVGPDMDNYVVWDYHVVAVSLDYGSDGIRRAVVLDRDSLLGFPVSLDAYLQSAFRPDLFSDGYLDPSLQSMFRVVPASDFLRNFASDRSHMLVGATSSVNTTSTRATTPEGQEHGSTACPVAKDSTAVYLQPPPPYPPICGSNARSLGHTHNLFTHWLEMRGTDATAGEGFGKVLGSVEDLRAYFAQAMQSVV